MSPPTRNPGCRRPRCASCRALSFQRFSIRANSFHREWRGPMLNSLEGRDALTCSFQCDVLRFCVAYLLNLCFLPLMALMPNVETATFEWLRLRDLRTRLDLVSKQKRARSTSHPFTFNRQTSVTRNVVQVLRAAADASKGEERADDAATEEPSVRFDSVRSDRSIHSSSSASSFSIRRRATSTGYGSSSMSSQLRDQQRIFGEFINCPRPRDPGPKRDGLNDGSSCSLPSLAHCLSCSPMACRRVDSCSPVTDWYLYRVPSFKYSTRLLSDALIAVALSGINLSSDTWPLMTQEDGGGLWTRTLWALFVLWAAAGCLSEYRQIGRSFDDWKQELRSLVQSDLVSIYRTECAPRPYLQLSPQLRLSQG